MPDPFITRQDLTDILGRTVTADAGALIATDAACDICRDIAGQTFNRGTTTVALDGTGTDALLLRERPVNSAGTVIVNGGTVTDYVLNGDGVLLRGTAGVDPRPVWPMGRQNITVTYDHGYEIADIPRSLRKVALDIASRSIVQGVASEESLGTTVRVRYSVGSSDLTENELRILRRHGSR